MTTNFTKEDARVLKQVAKVKQLGADGAKVILLAPVADLLLAMDSPVEFSANLLQSDYAAIAQGAGNIQKIAACTAHDIVVLHIEDGDPSPVGDALTYFEKLSDALDKRCQQ